MARRVKTLNRGQVLLTVHCGADTFRPPLPGSPAVGLACMHMEVE
jgi:hypothetical protein